MRTTIVLLVSAGLLCACSDGEIRLNGTLADGDTDAPLHASVGEGEPVELVDGAFTLTAIPAGPIDLYLWSEGEEVGRMEIRDLRGGTTLDLERIHLDGSRDRAFPSAVRLAGTEIVTINGIRMAEADGLRGELQEDAQVLAVRSADDALIVRPERDDLPDLPVMVTSATRIVDLADDELPLSRVSPGDFVRVTGRFESGYLIADGVVVTPASRREIEEAREQRSPVPAAPSREVERADRDRDRGRDDDDDDDEVRRGPPPGLNRGVGPGPGRGQSRGGNRRRRATTPLTRGNPPERSLSANDEAA